jgi:hypothetical protein
MLFTKHKFGFLTSWSFFLGNNPHLGIFCWRCNYKLLILLSAWIIVVLVFANFGSFFFGLLGFFGGVFFFTIIVFCPKTYFLILMIFSQLVFLSMGDALTHDSLAPNSIQGFDHNSLWASSMRLMLQNPFIIAYWRK